MIPFPICSFHQFQVERPCLINYIKNPSYLALCLLPPVKALVFNFLLKLVDLVEQVFIL